MFGLTFVSGSLLMPAAEFTVVFDLAADLEPLGTLGLFPFHDQSLARQRRAFCD